MQQNPSFSDNLVTGFPPGDIWSLNGLGQSDGSSSDTSDFGTQLAQALPALASSAASVINTIDTQNRINQYTQAGIYPTGYSPYGVPIYATTPAGVTPNNPYSLPSAYGLPAGVTPTYAGYPSLYPSTYGNPYGYGQSASMSPTTLLIIGGIAVALLAFAK